MSKIIKIRQLFLNLQPIIGVDVFFLKHGVVVVIVREYVFYVFFILKKT